MCPPRRYGYPPTSTLRLELGLPGFPFEHSYSRFHRCTTRTYPHTMWEFCNDHAFLIKDNQGTLKLQRQNDQFLMQSFDRQGYSDSDLQLLNICRMWAKVTTLAVISTGDGKHLLLAALERNFVTQHQDTRPWPKAGQPNTHCWTLWKGALTSCYLRPYDQFRRLRNPLGQWPQRSKHWKWYYSPALDYIFEHDNDHQHWTQQNRNQGARASHHQGFRRTTTRAQ
jgi:hypothetical protein